MSRQKEESVHMMNGTCHGSFSKPYQRSSLRSTEGTRHVQATSTTPTAMFIHGKAADLDAFISNPRCILENNGTTKKRTFRNENAFNINFVVHIISYSIIEQL